MKRKCYVLRKSADNKKFICIDVETARVILSYIGEQDKRKKKFKYIMDIILNNLRMPDVYDKEELTKKCKGVTAMKFFKQGDNDRIYCKEQSNADGTFIVVSAVLLEKKKINGVNDTIIAIAEKIGTYEYEITEEPKH